MACRPRIPAAYIGMTQQQALANLAIAQQALSQLKTGSKAVTVAYAAGDGTRSVTYNQVGGVDAIGAATYECEQLAAIAYPGQGYGRRRPLRMVYR